MLNNFATIFSGYTYRSPLQNIPFGEYTFLQPKDINLATHSLDFSGALKTNDFQGAGKYKLIKGDILIAGKGKSVPVVVFNEAIRNVVATSALIVIRTHPDHLNPFYLAWYMEQPEAQNYFLSRKSGTTVLNLPIRAIQDLEVPLLPISKQNTFGELYIGRNKLKATQLAILEKECQVIDCELSQLLKQECI